MSEHNDQLEQTSDSSILKGGLINDLISSVVVFLVALPLCLGIALASGADPFAGVLAGIVGGIVVGMISGSHTSVSGPAAGLTAIVAAQLDLLGSFEAFLLAVVVGGLIQIGFGIAKAGSLSAFFPSSIIRGLLAAIGVILILKQIPHLLGHDSDPEGEMSFHQPDDETTFSELLALAGDVHPGAIVVGITCLLVLIFWTRIRFLEKSRVPAPLFVVLLGVGINAIYHHFSLSSTWLIGPSHLVEVPVAQSAREFIGFLTLPDFSRWMDPLIYQAGFTIAVVASLETLLNLEAVDKLDLQQRHSPPSRELVAQGCGNVCSGMIGGLPVTSVIVRSSVNVSSGSRTKLSAVAHGFLLLLCVSTLPTWLNSIPLASLAAILLHTGYKLANPAMFMQMWKQGRYQFIPFIVTLIAIVLTDLLSGILIGLAVSVLFILNSNLRTPIRRVVETHLGGEITHVELAPQVSFLNRAALSRIFDNASEGSQLLIDASETKYIDPDVLTLIREFQNETAPARGVSVSLRGFRDQYQLQDEVEFVDYSTRELKDRVSPDQVLDILREGNRRFRTGHRLSRNLGSQIHGTSNEQHPLALVLTCIDSRVPGELIFDSGLGDIFSVRVAGNVVGSKTLASVEFGVGVSGVKLVLVMGHTGCGAVTAAVEKLQAKRSHSATSDYEHLHVILDEIAPSVEELASRPLTDLNEEEMSQFVDQVARRNVERSVRLIQERSRVVRDAVNDGNLVIIGALYDVRSGEIEFLQDSSQATDGT